MGLFARLTSAPSDAAQAYTASPVKPSPLQMAGTLADVFLTGGLFHALNQRNLQQGLLAAQRQDGQQIAGMFGRPSVTQSAPAPVPDTTAPGGLNLFAGGQYGAAPTQAFGGNSVAVSPGHVPTMEEALPLLMRANALHGTNISQALAAIQAAEPSVKIGPDGTPYNEKDPAVLSRRFGNPQNVNDTIVNLNDPANVNRVIPKAPIAGAMPVYDNQGRVVDWSMPKGAAGVIRLNAQAGEDAKAADDLVSINMPDGSTRQVPRLQAVQLLAGRGGGPTPGAAAPGAAPSGAPGDQSAFGVSQSPAEKALAEQRAKTQGTREDLQPKEFGALQDLDNTSGMTSQIIHQIIGDVRDPKTGAWRPGGKPQATGMTTGAIGELLHGLPGTPQHDLDQQLEHIRAMTSIEQLQNLRDNSPTGAGLGRVTQSEINLLAAMRGSIDQGQRLPQFNANLRRQLGQLDAMIGNRRKVYDATYGNIEQPAPGSTAPKAPTYSKAAPSHDVLQAEARRRGLIH